MTLATDVDGVVMIVGGGGAEPEDLGSTAAAAHDIARAEQVARGVCAEQRGGWQTSDVRLDDDSVVAAEVAGA